MLYGRMELGVRGKDEAGPNLWWTLANFWFLCLHIDNNRYF